MVQNQFISRIYTMIKINIFFWYPAWLKFYEIISEYKCLETKTPKLTSLHLCEAPGGFVTSLNHYISLNYSKDEVIISSSAGPILNLLYVLCDYIYMYLK